MTNIITIKISGPVGSGKSAVLQTIKELLQDHGLCVAVPDRELRLNPPATIAQSSGHEAPGLDKTVVVIEELIAH